MRLDSNEGSINLILFNVLTTPLEAFCEWSSIIRMIGYNVEVFKGQSKENIKHRRVCFLRHSVATRLLLVYECRVRFGNCDIYVSIFDFDGVCCNATFVAC